jgi:hypothetical protein
MRAFFRTTLMLLTSRILLCFVAILQCAAGLAESAPRPKSVISHLSSATLSIEVVDPGVPDTVRIGPSASGLGSPVVVPIYFFCDETLGGIQIIVSYDTLSLLCDSISFVGTSLANGAKLFSIDSTLGIVNAGVLYTAEETIPPQTGFFGALYLHQFPPPQSGAVVIDSATITIDSITVIQTVFSTSNPAFSIFPQFEFLPIVIENYVPGDANNDVKFNIADVTFMIARIFSGGAAPPIPAAADPNADCNVNIADVTFMIARIFSSGPAPQLGCAT